MDDYRINTNYAKALYLLANDMDCQEQVVNDMQLVRGVFSENRILRTVFSDLAIKQGQKMDILNELFSQRVSKPSLMFLQFVVRKNRSASLLGISDAYMQLYRKEHGIVLTNLTTAIEPDQDIINIAERVVQNSSGCQVELVSHVNPKIIGGFSIEYDNNMFDARISSRLAALRRSFAENEYEAKL